MTSRYGPRDAATVLMAQRGPRGKTLHKVALRWTGKGSTRESYWVLDGQRVTLAELEDRAEKYEKLRDRRTPRRLPAAERPRAVPAGGPTLASATLIAELQRDLEQRNRASRRRPSLSARFSRKVPS